MLHEGRDASLSEAIAKGVRLATPADHRRQRLVRVVALPRRIAKIRQLHTLGLLRPIASALGAMTARTAHAVEGGHRAARSGGTWRGLRLGPTRRIDLRGLLLAMIGRRPLAQIARLGTCDECEAQDGEQEEKGVTRHAAHLARGPTGWQGVAADR